MSRVDNNYFTYRQTPTTENGTGTIVDIKGQTLVWHQKAKPLTSQVPDEGITTRGVTITKATGGYKVVGTVTQAFNMGFQPNINLLSGHKYYFSGTPDSLVESCYYYYYVDNETAVRITHNGIFEPTEDYTGGRINTRFAVNSVWDNAIVNQLFDLTEMFGAGNEPTEEEFKSLFPLSFYDYADEASLLSFNGNGIKTVGKNLLNYSAWENANIIGGTAVFENNGVTLTATVNDCYTKYQIGNGFPAEAIIPVIQGKDIILSWESDEDDVRGLCYIFPNGKTAGMVNADNISRKWVKYTPSSGITFITFRFGVEYQGQTIHYKNIMISYSDVAQPFEPYTSSTLSLPISTYFPTGMKSAGNVHDELTPTKAITRIGEVDLSSLTWNYNADYQLWVSIQGIRNSDQRCLLNANIPYQVVGLADAPKQGSKINNTYNIWIRNGSDTIQPSGIAYYILGTPTETDISPELDLTFNIDAGGTEELLPVNGSTPTTSPILCDIFYRGMIPVSVVVYPIGAGTVTGAGEYRYGETATLVATPNDIYRFLRYEDENGDTLSTDSTYSFEVGE